LTVNRRTSNEGGFNLLETILALILIVVVCSIAISVADHIHSEHMKARETTAKTTTRSPAQSTGSVLSQNAANNARKNDAAAILATVSEYLVNNNGTLPKTTATGATANKLLICDTHCNSGNSSSASLDFYTPAKVTFQSYASNLTIPNDNTVYIVTGATCSPHNTIGTPVNSTSTLVLYALQNGSGMTQQCQVT